MQKVARAPDCPLLVVQVRYGYQISTELYYSLEHTLRGNIHVASLQLLRIPGRGEEGSFCGRNQAAEIAKHGPDNGRSVFITTVRTTLQDTKI
jgi:hypothetical protein